jgi:hypothetical protein
MVNFRWRGSQPTLPDVGDEDLRRHAEQVLFIIVKPFKTTKKFVSAD